MLADGTSRLSEEIGEISPRVKLAARQGFAIAKNLSASEFENILNLVLSSIEKNRTEISSELVLGQLDLPRWEAGRLMAALSVTLGLLSDNNGSIEEFMKTARDEIFDDSSESVARTAADLIIRKRPVLAEAMARGRLAAEVLPSLAKFDITVDLRARFRDDTVQNLVSVAIVHIDTDAMNQEVWLQLTASDIDDILTKLKKAAKQIGVLEGLIAGKLTNG